MATPNPANATFNVNGGSASFAGNLTVGDGANTNGNLNVTAGTLAIGAGGSLSNASVSGGTLDGVGTVSNVTVANNAASVVANGNGTAANFNVNSLTFGQIRSVTGQRRATLNLQFRF